MSTWSYNNGGVGGLTAIVPYNSGMTGLAAFGNVIQAVVGQPEASQVMFRPPGGSWSACRTTGLKQRVVEWSWQIVATSEINLWAVERVIESYLSDGREFTLSDGTRSSPFAVLTPQGTGPASNPRLIQAGAYMRQWRLRFAVLRPQIGAALL